MHPCFIFGAACLLLAIICLVLTRATTTQVNNVNAWYKPFKFAASLWLYSWTMAWYCHYLPSFNTALFSWSVIVLLGFEIVYISLMAGRGLLSHFNLSTPFYSIMYSLMALAATAVTLYTAYVGVLFFTVSLPALPPYYVWAIRLGIVLFVVFSLEGFVMGSRLSHTIGGPDGGPGIPVLNWSTKFGDPRIAHFIGMHALQVLPLLSYYLLRNTRATLLLATCFGLLAVFALVQALKGKPLVPISNKHTTVEETQN